MNQHLSNLIFHPALDRPAAARYSLIKKDSRVVDRGIEYKALHCSREGVVLRRMDETDANVSFTQEQIYDALNRVADPMQIIPRFYAESNAKARLLGSAGLACLNAEDQEDVIRKEFFVRSFLRMEAEYKTACRQARIDKLSPPPTVSRSSGPMRRVIRLIALEWRDLQMQKKTSNPTYRSEGAREFYQPGHSTLKGWIQLMEQNEFNPICLKNNYRTEREEYFTADELVFLDEAVKDACSTTRPNIAALHSIMEGKIKVANESRPQHEQLRVPNVDTLRNRYNDIPDAHRELGRNGIDTASRDWQPVMGGKDVVRALEEVQFDDHETDLQSLLVQVKVWQTLTKEQRKLVKRVRLWISAMIDVASRSIVALVVSPLPPSMRSAMAALEMATRDKTSLAQRLGCSTAWDQGGTPELMVVDSAMYFSHRPLRVAVNDAGIDLMLPRAGDAPARGHIERWFRTFGDGMFNFFSGRTWGSPSEKGDYDAEAHAAMVADQVGECFTRWVVDVYHNRPHSELNWATPRDRWLELSQEYGVLPGPTGAMRTHLFGTMMERKCSTKGLRIAGVQYQSKQLQQIYRENKKKPVWVRVNNHNRGSVSVLYKNGWIEVPCVYPEMEGVSIWQWLAAVEKLRLFHSENAKASRGVMLKTLSWLKDQADMARLEAGLASPILTEEDYARFDRKMNRVFELTDGSVAGEVRPEGEWHPSDDLFAMLGIQPVVYSKLAKAAKAEAKAAKEAAEAGGRPSFEAPKRNETKGSARALSAQTKPQPDVDEPVIQRITDIFGEE